MFRSLFQGLLLNGKKNPESHIPLVKQPGFAATVKMTEVIHTNNMGQTKMHSFDSKYCC